MTFSAFDWAIRIVRREPNFVMQKKLKLRGLQRAEFIGDRIPN